MTASVDEPRAARRSRGKSAFEGLHVLADDDPRWKHDPVDQARAACAGGASVVQLRAKRATDREALAWGEAIRDLTRRAGLLFLVNDRFDLALACGADGVHLGQGDRPPAYIPEAVRERLVVGRSTHRDDELAVARSEPVDYVAFGPVFETHSKRGADPARGLAQLAAAAAGGAPRPVIAIGGIDHTRVGDVKAAGAAGFAVIGAVAGADDPERSVRELVRVWEGASA
jgi:thiamine-phosphate diphosphorylase